jgi:hypothetical protein
MSTGPCDEDNTDLPNDVSVPVEDETDRNNNDDDDDDVDEEDDPFSRLRPVARVVDLEAIERLASSLRKGHVPAMSPCSDLCHSIDSSFTCALDPEPLFGGYNLVYTITFSDGVKWVARVPGHALEFDE